MKRTSRRSSSKKRTSVNKKSIGVERIRMLRQAFSQLQGEDRTKISGNPVSLVPVFAMQSLYSLRWGGSSNLNFIMTYSSASIPVDRAIINIELTINENGKEKNLDIESLWIQKDTNMTVQNKCNGHRIPSTNFRMNTEREKFDNAARAMKKLIANVIIQVSKGKIK
ncbi:MAG: hypothetical protein ABI340_07735 [Nitrososphaera sp.]|jgi:hypothetical protein